MVIEIDVVLILVEKRDKTRVDHSRRKISEGLGRHREGLYNPTEYRNCLRKMLESSSFS